MAETETRARLQPGETVIQDVALSAWWTSQFYPFSLGLWAIWRKRHRYVLTDQRVIALKGIVSKSERSVPLDRIQDAQLDRSPLRGGWVKLSTAGGTLGFDKIGPLTQAIATEFSDALMAELAKRRQTGGV